MTTKNYSKNFGAYIKFNHRNTLNINKPDQFTFILSGVTTSDIDTIKQYRDYLNSLIDYFDKHKNDLLFYKK